jgi:hypothetical protein
VALLTLVVEGRPRGRDGVIEIDGGGVHVRVVNGHLVMRKQRVRLAA